MLKEHSLLGQSREKFLRVQNKLVIVAERGQPPKSIAQVAEEVRDYIALQTRTYVPRGPRNI